MEALYVSLIGLAVSGITFIAYKHPVLYEKQFSPKIFIVSGLVFLAFVFHDAGVSDAHKELTPYLKDGVGEQIKKAVEDAQFPSQIFLGVLGVIAYALFLSWLADHMMKEYGLKKNKEESDKEDDNCQA